MFNYTALPLTAAESKIAREFWTYGMTLQKIRQDEAPNDVKFMLGITEHMRTGTAVLAVTDEWIGILYALASARESGIHASGRRMRR